MEQYLPVVTALLFFYLRICELKVKHDTVPGQVRESTTLKAFIAAGSILVLGGAAEHLILRKGFDPYLLAAGIALNTASVLLRRRAIATLGRMWSRHVEIRERHELILAGPYRWVRHPAYLSMILEHAAVLVLLRSYIAFVLSMLFFLPAYVRRIRLEERSLVEAFGARYEAYRARTPMLLPYRMPRKAEGAVRAAPAPTRAVARRDAAVRRLRPGWGGSGASLAEADKSPSSVRRLPNG